MRVDSDAPFMRIREWRREFVTGTHLSADVFFTVRKVTQEPRYIFDAYLPGFNAGSTFMLLENYEETYTDFDELAAQYAAFYFSTRTRDDRAATRVPAALRALRVVGRERRFPLRRLRPHLAILELLALQQASGGNRHPKARPSPVHAAWPADRQELSDAPRVPVHVRRIELREIFEKRDM